MNGWPYIPPLDEVTEHTEREENTTPPDREPPRDLPADPEHDETYDQAEERLSEKERELSEREERVALREKQIEESLDRLAGEQRRLEEERREARRQMTEIDARKASLAALDERLSGRERAVFERELTVETAEQESGRKLAEAREAMEKELLEAREAAFAEIDRTRRNLTGKMEQEIAGKRAEAESAIAARESEARGDIDTLYRKADEERKTAYAALKKEMAQLREETARECAQECRNAQEEIKAREQVLLDRGAALDAREKELESREEALEADREQVDRAGAKNRRDQRIQERKESDLEAREDDIEKEAAKRAEDLVRNCQVQLREKDTALDQLREQLAKMTREQDAVEDFKKRYGDTPELIKAEITRLEMENVDYANRLATRPGKEVQAERDRLLIERDCLQRENEGLQKRVADLTASQRNTESVKAENARLEDALEAIQFQAQVLQERCKSYEADIRRLSSDQSRLAEYDERMKVIRAGGMVPLTGADIDRSVSERQWLDRIWNNCKEFGMIFPKRILYAFHTALKISDWSMITVLSGVSGTGKSELPKLYAAFGGMNFINVPVQPSWDSQESMLGFFNSIDNRFEPEPLLRFLVQCTEDAGFNRYMSIVLLDEMNLAHVEHYFADFLSKLETRRGASKNSLPSVEVKLGAGVEPYRLELKRSILWTGTMNQDETTKSLSDKVLDRGLVIYFPRPEHLTDREKMLSLEDAVSQSGRALMTTAVWNRWIFRDLGKLGEGARKQINRYREMVERINQELEGTGRALGHRVWQAIEYYIVNYPAVREALESGGEELTQELREAMDLAFEDQLVQKVMPKLRGIETRGESRQRLRKIEDLLEEEGFDRLKDDFDLAMELGYGQFIWSSAKYIQAGEAVDEVVPAPPETDG